MVAVCFQQTTGEQAVTGGRHLVSPKDAVTYAAVTATAVATAIATPQPPSGPLKPTAKSSDPSELAISQEMAQRRMSPDMSGPLSGMPDANTHTPRWPTNALGSTPTRPPSK